MEFHFILKEVEAGAVSRCLFFLARDSEVDAPESLPKPTLNLLLGLSFLRPFRIILPNNTILSLATKSLYYDPLRII